MHIFRGVLIAAVMVLFLWNLVVVHRSIDQGDWRKAAHSATHLSLNIMSLVMMVLR